MLGSSYRLNIFEGASLLAPDTGQAEASALGRSGLLFADLGLIYLHIISPPKLIRTVLPPIRQTWMGFGDPAVWMHRRWLWELEKDRPQTWSEFVEGISFQEESDLPSPQAAFSEGRNEIRLFLEAESSAAGRLRLQELKAR
ncbi:MAG TPA: hypothetical protein VMN76_07330 [Acidobacteriota bacterium]|nr:hypothetical protein [Acidobacteriota bacterium]